jgi:putative transposase
MLSVLISLLLTLRGIVRSRAALHLEVLALRHQLQVLQRSRPRRLRLAKTDRWLWAWLSRSWTAWRTALVIVKPETVIAGHRQGFRLYWTWKSRQRTGRPTVDADVRALIRSMVGANPLWGAPRIHGELLKLGLEVSQATVAKYMPRRITPPSQTWRTFLANHVHQIAAADFFVVPTATCRLLFVLVILAHERRRVVHVGVTNRPTAAWTAQQLREACPWDEAPRYLGRDRDTAFAAWATTAMAIGINEVMTAAHSPWQNAYAERLIGSIRRECLDHVIVANERGLRRVLRAYLEYYLKSRTHLSLGKDAPVSRPIAPPGDGAIVAVPHLGGLHHRYERRAA